MSETIRTDNGWKATERDPVDGDVVGIRLVYKTGTLHPTAVRVATASAAQDFPYDHNRSSAENAGDCLEQWLKFRRELKDWYAERDRLPALAMPGEDE